MRALLNFLFNRLFGDRAWFRRATDVECFCVNCGRSVGYVWLGGHKHWLCARCSETGHDEAVAAVPRAY